MTSSPALGSRRPVPRRDWPEASTTDASGFLVERAVLRLVSRRGVPGILTGRDRKIERQESGDDCVRLGHGLVNV